MNANRMFIAGACLGLAILTGTGNFCEAQNPTPFTPGIQQGNGSGDDIQSQIDEILGEYEDDIMGGIKDAIINMVVTTISDALGINSPLKAVEKLKEMMKDGYSKQQKIEYQQYKVDFQEKAVHTTLSSSFVNYYKVLDLNGKVQALDKIGTSVQNIIGSKVFTAAEKSAMRTAVSGLGDVEDLVDEVTTACNLKKKEAVWMSEAERMQILESAKEELKKRQTAMNLVRRQLVNAYAMRVRNAAQNTALSNMYESDTQLNRTLSTTKKSY